MIYKALLISLEVGWMLLWLGATVLIYNWSVHQPEGLKFEDPDRYVISWATNKRRTLLVWLWGSFIAFGLTLFVPFWPNVLTLSSHVVKPFDALGCVVLIICSICGAYVVPRVDRSAVVCLLLFYFLPCTMLGAFVVLDAGMPHFFGNFSPSHEPVHFE